MAYCRASLINLYLHTKFDQNWENFFVDGRTYLLTDISEFRPPSNVIRVAQKENFPFFE